MNPNRLDLVSLRLFVASVEAGSFASAARLVALSVPAISKRVSELETAAGVRLLVRTRRGVVPTAAGQALHRHARQVGSDVDQLCLTMSDFRSGTREHIRVWANTSAVTGFLPGFLSEFLAAHPHVSIDLEEVNSEPLVRAVEAQVADLGVFAGNIDPGTLESAVCDLDRLVIVAPHGHALSRRKRIGFDACLRHDFVGLNPESALMRQMQAVSGHVGKKIRLRVQVRSFDAICKMVAKGLGIGLLPLSAAEAHARSMPLSLVDLSDPWAQRRELLVGWRRDALLGPSAQEFLGALRGRVALPDRTPAGRGGASPMVS